MPSAVIELAVLPTRHCALIGRRSTPPISRRWQADPASVSTQPPMSTRFTTSWRTRTTSPSQRRADNITSKSLGMRAASSRLTAARSSSRPLLSRMTTSTTKKRSMVSMSTTRATS